ncbi:MAG: NADH-quinone oxidoreductase subunit N, partial [Cyanobacteria bacterium REEB65]|nr:NADH-quinone oxidoreductase subunit N [Cyanobacteria bacterium REEB65]
FKIAAFPFHMWAPDVYHGAPAPITGFMATAVKAASFAFMIRVLLVGFGAFHPLLLPTLWWLAVLTMCAGNLFALPQTNLKRMLAYSSVAHTGYLLVGLVAALSGGAAVVGNAATAVQLAGGSAMLFYLAAYALTNLGAFACVSYLAGRKDAKADLADWAGIAREHPWVAVAMSLCMLSLIGFPPTAGFLGKYLLFSAAIGAGQTSLAVIGILNSILSVWYYLRVIVVMTMSKAQGPLPSRRSGAGVVACYSATAVLWAGFGTFTLLGIWPGAQALEHWAQVSIGSLFGF